jgi:hypothetical protein
MQTGTPGRARSRHRLLPYERWLADYGDRQGPGLLGSDRWRMQQNFGPDGMALLVAASVDVILGWLIAATGLALRWISVGGPAGGYLIGIGLFVILVGFVRCIQCARAGRIYRAGRPFLRVRGPFW